MANVYDAIVIGGGHNGLTAGAYFARAGARTVVLEARNKTGGAADTSAPFPDHPEIHVTTYSYVMSLMPPTIIKELNLKRHGYDVTAFGPYYQAYPDGRSIMVYADDAARSHDSIAQFSKKDAETLPQWEAWLQEVADVLGPLLLQKPPKIGSMAFGDLIESARAAWKVRKLGVRGVGDVTRLFTMSITDLLDDWFESDEIKGMLAVNGIIGTWAGPDEPGTAYVMLHHSIGDVGDGHLGSWGFQQGGMGAVSDSIRRSAESFGCEIRTDARVQKVLTQRRPLRGRRARERRGAPSAARGDLHPSEDRVPRPDRSRGAAGRFRLGHRAVAHALGRREDQRRDVRAPGLHRRPGQQMQDHHTGSVELCFTPQYAEEAFQDSHMGRKASVRPFVDGVIPTTLDKKLAPEGVHVFSMFTQWVPDDWNLEPHRDELEQYADRIIDLYTELAPNFKAAVIDRQVLGPYDMEQELGLIGGNIFHGELSVDQLFHMRPAPGYADYRTPIKGLYHGSSATHAGGGVNGIPGWQAYRAAVRDRAVKKPR